MIIIRIIVFKSLTFFARGGFIQETLVARTKTGSSMSAVGWRRSSLQVSFLSANVNDIFVQIMSNIWKHIFPRWRWKCGSGSHWRRHQSRTGWSCQPSHAGGHIFFKNLPWSTIGFKKMFLSTIGSAQVGDQRKHLAVLLTSCTELMKRGNPLITFIQRWKTFKDWFRYIISKLE